MLKDKINKRMTYTLDNMLNVANLSNGKRTRKEIAKTLTISVGYVGYLISLIKNLKTKV